MLPNVERQTADVPKRALLPRLFNWTVWVAFLLLLYISVVQTEFRFDDLWGSTRDFVLFFGNFWPPDWRALPEIWGPLVETLVMAYLGTLFGVILGVPWLFWSSRNTAPNVVLMWFSRIFMTVLRSVPDLLYAAVLVAILSLGPLPGVVAITIFTLSILAKLGSEYVEAVDPGPLEALRASGASGTHVIVYGVVPQVAASMISYILYIFEVNVRASTVLGFVGAGGIGQTLFTYISLFDYPAIAVLLIITFVVVAMIDTVSAFVRARLT
ncbi:MAG: phosphonate ABC transporter, permease protein PhnE [Trueperaceae bacterium]|nr:phosphonate ABC transporter, permease protein PhnE [Trueperaceae bacterium]